MSVRLDTRAGSGELAPLFAPYGIKPLLCTLPFGDIEFEGQGPHGTCIIGIERKRISDLISSMQSKRLSGHQLPGMAERFDYAYLMVEGIFQPAPDGTLLIRTGGWSPTKMSYRAVDSYLSTMELKCGMIYRRTCSDLETVAVIVSLYRWWRDKTWAEHRSHDVVYAPADLVDGRRFFLNRRKPNLVEAVAMQLPGIDQKARTVAKSFKTIAEMLSADAKTWGAIDGIGKIGAKRLVEAIHGPVQKL